MFATRSGADGRGQRRAPDARGRRGAREREPRARGLPPLPDKLTPHSLRRTFCSLLYALGEDPGVVMDEMGHTDPGLALRVYRQSMRRGEDEGRAPGAGRGRSLGEYGQTKRSGVLGG